MGVAHGIFDHQVGHGVAQLGITRFRVVALQLAPVTAIADVVRRRKSIDGLAADTQAQRIELTFVGQAGLQPAPADGTEEVMAHVFLAD